MWPFLLFSKIILLVSSSSLRFCSGNDDEEDEEDEEDEDILIAIPEVSSLVSSPPLGLLARCWVKRTTKTSLLICDVPNWILLADARSPSLAR